MTTCKTTIVALAAAACLIAVTAEHSSAATLTNGATWPGSPIVQTWDPTASSDTGQGMQSVRNLAQSFQFSGGDLKLDKLFIEYRNGAAITVDLRIFAVADVNQSTAGCSGPNCGATPSGADLLNITGLSMPAPSADGDFLEIDLVGAEEITLPELTGTAGYVFQILPATNGPEWTFKNPSGSNPYSAGRGFRDDIDYASGLQDMSLAIEGTLIQQASPAPEPNTLVLAALGLVGLAVRRRRNR